MQTKLAAVRDLRTDEKEIRALVDRWLIASEKGDLPTIRNLMSDDVVFMVPGKEPSGRETFAQSYQQLEGIKITTNTDIQELKVTGDWAWMRTFLTVTFTSTNGDSSAESGYALTILRKNLNGNWVIARDANLLMPVRGKPSNDVEAKSWIDESGYGQSRAS